MSSALPNMRPLTALGGEVPRTDTYGPVTLTEISDLALASVAARRGQEEVCRAHMAAMLNRPEPGIEELVLHEPEACFWIGSDQWMVIAPHPSHENLAELLVHRFGASASITEQNDAWAVFDLQGDVTPVMELLCPINMRTFRAGSARRTSIDHLGCFVTRWADDHLRIMGPRSSAGSLHHALLYAMRSAH